MIVEVVQGRKVGDAFSRVTEGKGKTENTLLLASQSRRPVSEPRRNASRSMLFRFSADKLLQKHLKVQHTDRILDASQMKCSKLNLFSCDKIRLVIW